MHYLDEPGLSPAAAQNLRLENAGKADGYGRLFSPGGIRRDAPLGNAQSPRGEDFLGLVFEKLHLLPLANAV